MKNVESLRAGIGEMRSVAQRLLRWAEDMEASLQGETQGEAEQGAEEKKPLTLPEVRAALAEKCAAGFGAQVKGLIESYGVSSLKDVPEGKYGELLETAANLGAGGDADAG